MTALCGEHHAKADAGAFTIAQLREMKRSAISLTRPVHGHLNWMRRELLVFVGSNWYERTPLILTYRQQPLIWFERSDEGYLGVNFRMLSLASEPRIGMRNNFWILGGRPTNFVCPPSGRSVEARYANGDAVRIEFTSVTSPSEGERRFRGNWPADYNAGLPSTAVEIWYTVGGTTLAIGPNGLGVAGSHIRNGLFPDCGPISIGENPHAAISSPEPAVLRRIPRPT
jgi:hypothetical protein